MSQEITLEIFNDVVGSLNKQIADLDNQLAVLRKEIEKAQNDAWAAQSFIGTQFPKQLEEHWGSVSVWYEFTKERQKEEAEVRRLTHQLEARGFTVAKREEPKIKKAK